MLDFPTPDAGEQRRSAPYRRFPPPLHRRRAGQHTVRQVTKPLEQMNYELSAVSRIIPRLVGGGSNWHGGLERQCV